MSNLTGQTLLGRYRIDAFLGRGGMAEVYRAWDTDRSVYVALKMLNADLAEDYVFLRRFAREARAIELLQHPHVVRFFGFEETRGLAFLVMEYIDGVTLRRQLKLLGRPLALPEALAVLQPVCSALHYAHTMGIYHCDVKPANIFIERGGRVVLGDFGIARLSESATVTFSTSGTPAYMAPEQCREEDVDARTDVYSLGIMAYEVLTLDRPFKGETAETTGSRSEQVRWEQMNALPPSPRSLNPAIPPEAEAATLQALEKEPRRRQPGVSQFCSDLSGGGKVQAVTVLPWDIGDASVAAPPPPEGDKRRPVVPLWGMGAAVVAMLIVMVGLVAWLWPDKGGGEDAVVTLAAQLTAGAQADTADVASRPGDTPLPQVTPTAHPLATLSPAPSRAATATPLPIPTPTLRTQTLVFDSYRDGNWEVYSVGEEGTGSVNLTNDPADDGDPARSFDGRRIAFDSDRDGNWEIYVMNADGTGTIRLTNHPAEDDSPTWSPDGSQIAFKSNRDGNWEIYVVHLVDLSVTNLTNHPADDRVPAWSPDGRHIAFVSDRTGDWDIWVMNADGSGLANLTRHPDRDSFPDWSPDGRQIAFHSYRDGNAEIYVMQADGSGLVRVTHDSADDWGPSWSPDGSRLAFTSDRDGDNEVYIMDASGDNVVQVTRNTASDTWPVWLPMP
jgi:Tol biopolymer transport system component